jgi:hypothetical protein
MLPETTVFGVLLVLAIALTLMFLLLRKPPFRIPGTPVEKARRESKSDEDKKVTQMPKPRAHPLAKVGESPKTVPVPQAFLSSAKPMERQIGQHKLPNPPHKEEHQENPTSPVQAEEASKKPSQPVKPPKVTRESPVPIPPNLTQLRPPNCRHFFGYLRKLPKNASMPDDCFGCPKMVECLYYDAYPE